MFFFLEVYIYIYICIYVQILQSLYQYFRDCTNYNWYHCHFHIPRFFQFFSKVLLLILVFAFNFTLLSARTAKSTNHQILFFLLIIIRSHRLAEIWWSVCILKSQRKLCVSFSKTDTRLCIYHLFFYYYYLFL